MRHAGFKSETLTFDFYSKINDRHNWDKLVDEEWRYVPRPARRYFAFASALMRYDTFFISFDGFLLGETPLRYFQSLLFRCARKSVVVLPYGSDAYVYRNVRNPLLQHALMSSYPENSRRQDEIEKQVRYWVKHADFVIPGFMGVDGIGRWDSDIPSALCLDLTQWVFTPRRNFHNGTDGSVKIFHSSNHNNFKGTSFLEAAVDELQRDGLKIDLHVISGVKQKELLRTLRDEADILFEQCLFVGHGMSALEGMALGIPVVSNLEDPLYVERFVAFSFFGECPIASASPQNLADVLRELVTRPDVRQRLSIAGRSYVERHHGLDSAVELFSGVLEKISPLRRGLSE